MKAALINKRTILNGIDITRVVDPIDTHIKITHTNFQNQEKKGQYNDCCTLPCTGDRACNVEITISQRTKQYTTEVQKRLSKTHYSANPR